MVHMPGRMKSIPVRRSLHVTGSVLCCICIQIWLSPFAHAASPEKVIYSFGINSPEDGSDPVAGLVDLHGMMYGTT